MLQPTSGMFRLVNQGYSTEYTLKCIIICTVQTGQGYALKHMVVDRWTTPSIISQQIALLEKRCAFWGRKREIFSDTFHRM